MNIFMESLCNSVLDDLQSIVRTTLGYIRFSSGKDVLSIIRLYTSHQSILMELDNIFSNIYKIDRKLPVRYEVPNLDVMQAKINLRDEVYIFSKKAYDYLNILLQASKIFDISKPEANMIFALIHERRKVDAFSMMESTQRKKILLEITSLPEHILNFMYKTQLEKSDERSQERKCINNAHIGL